MDKEFEALVAELSRLTTAARKIRELAQKTESDSVFLSYAASNPGAVDILQSFQPLDNPKVLYDVRKIIEAAAERYEYAFSALTTYINAARVAQGQKPLEESHGLN